MIPSLQSKCPGTWCWGREPHIQQFFHQPTCYCRPGTFMQVMMFTLASTNSSFSLACSPLVKKMVQLSLSPHTVPPKRKALTWFQNRFKTMLTTEQKWGFIVFHSSGGGTIPFYIAMLVGCILITAKSKKCHFSIVGAWALRVPCHSQAYNSIHLAIPTLELSDCAFTVVNEAICAMSQESHLYTILIALARLCPLSLHLLDLIVPIILIWLN